VDENCRLVGAERLEVDLLQMRHRLWAFRQVWMRCHGSPVDEIARRQLALPSLVGSGSRAWHDMAMLISLSKSVPPYMPLLARMSSLRSFERGALSAKPARSRVGRAGRTQSTIKRQFLRFNVLAVHILSAAAIGSNWKAMCLKPCAARAFSKLCPAPSHSASAKNLPVVATERAVRVRLLHRTTPASSASRFFKWPTNAYQYVDEAD